MSNFYDFEAEDMKCNVHKMEEYRGNVVLIVNTATRCGFTPQYDALQDIYMRNIMMQVLKYWIFHVTSSVIRHPEQMRKSQHSVMRNLESHLNIIPK